MSEHAELLKSIDQLCHPQADECLPESYRMQRLVEVAGKAADILRRAPETPEADLDPAEVWEDYLEEVTQEEDRSLQGALAFGFWAAFNAVSQSPSTAMTAPDAIGEKIIGIIRGPLCDATKAEHSVLRDGRYSFCTQCGETITKPQINEVEAENKAGAILALFAAPVSAWQDISTAPHEQLVVLGWWHAGVWHSESGFASQGWSRNGVSTMSRHGAAKYWHPMPAAPVSRNDREGAAK